MRSGCAVGWEMAMIKAGGEAHEGERGILNVDGLVRLQDTCRIEQKSSREEF